MIWQKQKHFSSKKNVLIILLLTFFPGLVKQKNYTGDMIDFLV